MYRYLLFADTVNSLVDFSKNVRGDYPLAVIESSVPETTLSEVTKFGLRKKYKLESNQILRFWRIGKIQHWINRDKKALCGTNWNRNRRRDAAPWQEVFGFVNCAKCRKKLEK